jgi:hypothetical protein
MESVRPDFLAALDAICIRWNTSSVATYGFSIRVDGASVFRAYSLWEAILHGNSAFPKEPGPFKCAAAFMVCAWAEVKFCFEAADEAAMPTDDQKRLWKSRFLFKALPLILKQWGTQVGSGRTSLAKNWDVPTVHYRLDFLNFLRWTELPLQGLKTPPPPSLPTLNMERTNRLIMAFSLIIEVCYYQSGNELQCDIMGTAQIRTSEILEDLEPDLYFDCDWVPAIAAAA